MLVTGPTLAHSIVAARWGRRAFLSAALHPGWWAVLCWLTWRALSAPVVVAALASPTPRSTDVACEGNGLVFRTCAPVPAGQGVPLMPAVPPSTGVVKTFALMADMAYFAGLTLTAAAIVLAVASVLTSPTHVLGRDRRLHAVGRGPIGRPTLAARAVNRGMYARIKAGHAGMVSDWRASKRDAAALDKRLGKVGAWRLKRWGRRWAAEDIAGATRSTPGVVDRWLIRRTDPPKTKLGRKAAKRRADKRAARKGPPADYPDTPAARPHLDPNDGPPLSPRQRDEYAARQATEAQTVRARVRADAEGSAR